MILNYSHYENLSLRLQTTDLTSSHAAFTFQQGPYPQQQCVAAGQYKEKIMSYWCNVKSKNIHPRPFARLQGREDHGQQESSIVSNTILY